MPGNRFIPGEACRSADFAATKTMTTEDTAPIKGNNENLSFTKGPMPKGFISIDALSFAKMGKAQDDPAKIFSGRAGGAQGSSALFAIASLYLKIKDNLIVIADDNVEAFKIKEGIFALLPQAQVEVFCDYETLPYDMLSAHQDLISSRLEVLAKLPALKHGMVIVSKNALMQRLCPQSYIAANSLYLKKGDEVDLKRLRELLTQCGYLQVEQVLSHGEFALRGSILDIFPMGSNTPYRIDFFDEEIDSIATFSVDTQRSQDKIDAVKLLPAHEFALNESFISMFRSSYRDAFPSANLAAHTIYQTISKGALPSGIEYYLPLFFAQTATFFDYLKPADKVVFLGDLRQSAEAFIQSCEQRFAMHEGNRDHPPLPVFKVFLSPSELEENLQKFCHIELLKEPLSDAELKKAYRHNLYARAIPKLTLESAATKAMPEAQSAQKIDERLSTPQETKALPVALFVKNFLNEGGRIFICAGSEGRRQSLKELLGRHLLKDLGEAYHLIPASSFKDFKEGAEPLTLSVAPFEEGLIICDQMLCVLTENEILGYSAVKQRQRRRSKASISADAMIKNLSQLQEGQIVVHIDHGIGLYRGLKILNINGVKGEYLRIEYAGGDLLNIPITALNKVARYMGRENPVLSKLGSDNWGRKKHKAAQKILDAAAMLLDLNSRRFSRPGIKFNIDQEALAEFASGFGYELTVDQENAIKAALDDMASEKPMDRLICGDVGFGKTEVAMRAAFAAAHDGYQAAVLVPTTILAEQHYQSFKERFARTALTVDVISRFKTPKEQSALLKRLEDGSIDIIIGTHKILSRGTKFKNLGLIIIDEEHRFGVRQKERLKQLRSEADILTLTATPIPRTLNMAMEGMRELSVIATAPESRLAVKTFVHEDSNELCREAIMRELRRGGQIYYLHNDVATIEARAEQLAKLVPEAKIEVGHAQMNQRRLQQVMHDFYHQRFNLLLCSTIIENGLDIPSANTIIIDRADKFGLAQLHQLRGRVGRSHHQAYAYLFTPPKQVLSKTALMRLEAIASLEELGSGFVLATHDLEIRGAGELLGEDQSGQIESVGFSLYMDMLQKAIASLKEGREPSLLDLNLDECDIDMHLPSLLPDDYIGDINLRLSLYKRLAGAKSDEELADLKIEIIDRFGPLPQSTENLFAITALKLIASSLGIKRIAGSEDGGVIEFKENHKVDPGYIADLVMRCKHNEYRLSSPLSLKYSLKETEQRPRLALLNQLLVALRAHSKAEAA